MSRDGSGNYSLPAGNPVGTGTTISSTAHNATMTDVAAAITASIAKDGQTTPSANLPMGGYKHTGVANGSARDQYASVAQLQDDGPKIVGSVSGTNTITGTLTPAITAYATGMQVILLPAETNTGFATLSLNGLSARTILMADGNATLGGDLRPGLPVLLTYNGSAFVVTGANPTTAAFTITLTGVAESVTGTATYVRNGRMVLLAIPYMVGTSNTTSMTLTGMPVAIRPGFDQIVHGPFANDNGVAVSQKVDAYVANTGTITLFKGGSPAGWTSSGTKGIGGASIIIYMI